MQQYISTSVSVDDDWVEKSFILLLITSLMLTESAVSAIIFKL